ncbi:oligopeptide ABC transporter permease OppC [Spiroplasma turonicum]|uniref:Oligopeptide ABC transporter permease n=1 Tax=Spiroplasma turonicum TaxID=216946 RepID=A0A0K1P5U9_9MOLU|nr:oligopeptide ABC transporter permease OppC [Spiroplasma turonicum]AKU79688.1 oligopeptide ABC transporter permease [Spiroplasma turonicum]ALX70708.1 oligopeptide ABC transporter permease [Spiroplasma turonicum]
MKFKYLKQNFDPSKISNSLFTFSKDVDETKVESIDTKPYSYWKSVGKTVIKSKAFIISLILIIIFITLTITIARGEKPVPLDRPGTGPMAPNAEHWFGLVLRGEDLWNKMWIGSRSTLLFMVIIASVEIAIGIFIGLIWGFYSRLDMLFIEVIRFLTLIPSLILWLLVIYIYSLFNVKVSLQVLVVAISITSWIGMASVIRVQTILVRNAEYNVASKILGTKGPRIMVKNILPKILPIVIQTASFAIPNAIALDSLLAYYNFGFVNDLMDEASLGSILNEMIANTSWQIYPYLMIIPISFIGGISLLFFVVGKIFSDSLDPKLHR